MAKASKSKSIEKGLWDDTDGVRSADDTNKASASTKLQISSAEKILSKNQQMFNKLSQQIEKLQKEITAESERLNNLKSMYCGEVLNLENEVVQSQIDFALLLDSVSGKYKFNKIELENISEIIIWMLDKAFYSMEPTPEQIAIFDKWSKSSYQEELEKQEKENASFHEMFEAVFGNNNFDEDGGSEDPDSHHTDFGDKGSYKHKNYQTKTKKQQEKEEALRIEQELKDKNIRSVYISLAKVLHPDSESDPDARHEKEQVMKQVTVAYEQKNMTMLLQLEMEWVHKTADHLDQLTDEKLKTYIAVLKEQVEQLKNEKFALRNDPRYEIISDLLFLTEKQALRQIHVFKELRTGGIDEIKQMSAVITESKSKQKIGQIVKKMAKTIQIEKSNSSGFSFDEFDEFEDDVFDDEFKY